MRRLILCLLATIPASGAAQQPPPILDMHMHALAADAQGPPPIAICAPFDELPAWDPARPYREVVLERRKGEVPCDDPLWSAETDEALMRATIAVMERRNIVGVLGGTPERVAAWRAAAPGRFIAGIDFNPLADGAITPDSLRRLVRSGAVDVLAEVLTQFAGIAPDDERLEPYWSVAEELDVPVGIHVGPGPPGVHYLGATGYRARLHSALSLEEMLVRHPRLRVWIMHAGFPLLDDLLALLYAHPQVHVDVGLIAFAMPRAIFHRYLRAIVDAGFANRVMFGSDQMVWPGAIERAIAAIEEAPFLTEQQKRAILYDNAARFLRLDETGKAGNE